MPIVPFPTDRERGGSVHGGEGSPRWITGFTARDGAVARALRQVFGGGVRGLLRTVGDPIITLRRTTVAVDVP